MMTSMLNPTYWCRWLSAGVLAMALNPAAQAEIYRCVTASGVIEYSNAAPGKKRANVCKKLNLPAITTLPATPAPASRRPAAKESGKGFPKVTNWAQKRRDVERKKILQSEFKREQKKLDALQAEYQNGQPERLGSERNYQKYLDRVERLKGDIQRVKGNLSALRTELNEATK